MLTVRSRPEAAAAWQPLYETKGSIQNLSRYGKTMALAWKSLPRTAAIFLIFASIVSSANGASQPAAKNASVGVLVNKDDAFDYARAYEASAVPALNQGQVLRSEFHDAWPTKDQTYILDYEYANKGGLVLSSQLYVAKNLDVAKRVAAELVQGTLSGAKNSAETGMQLSPLGGLEGWQQDVTAFQVAAGGKPIGIMAVFRRGANVGVVSVLGRAAPKTAQAFKLFMRPKADKMLGFVPEF